MSNESSDSPQDDVQEKLAKALSERFTVGRKLGAGGMATVYLATDIKHDRAVAIKVLHPDLAASIGGERFEREIRLAAKLQHPNILGMFDSGQAEGLLFYMMPFVEGESLRDRIDREGQLPVDDAIHIALEVAEALGHAHAKGIVHRDIKPDNIMMSGGHALVADFGIARAADETAGKLTMTGMSVGTPTYMAPEQSAGEKVGTTADLYSLGCVLYEMLSGDPPFTGKNGMQIMAKHAMEAVPSVRIVRPNVPEEVEQAIFASMAKVPSDRPKDAAAFMEMLGVSMGNTGMLRAARATSSYRVPTSTHRVPTEQYPVAAPPRAWWRNPAVFVGGPLVLAAAAFGIWKFGPGKGTAVDGLDKSTVAVLYFEDGSADSSLRPVADGLTDGLISELGQVQGLRVISRGGVEQYRVSSLERDSIARALNAGTLVTGVVATSGDRLQVSVSLVDESGADFSRASFALPAAQLTQVRDSLTKEVARLIRQRVGTEIRLREQQARTSNPEAWSLVQRAEQRRRGGETAALSGNLDGMESNFVVADSLLRGAETEDPAWDEPTIARANLAYRRTRLIRRDPVVIKQWIDSGVALVNRALAINAENADALELRGNLNYWGWLVGIEADPKKASDLLTGARADFEKATTLNPRQAGAWASLSHLYYQVGTGVDINLAARRALESDAFLSNANVIVDRLFLSSYDLGNFADAEQWCKEGERRFPERFESARCRLQLLTTRAKSPDVPRAWVLADSMVALTPEQRRPLQTLHAHMLVAAVLARDGKGDSARAVVKRSLGNAEIDPSRDLTYTGAFVYTLLGDKENALQLLKTYLAANPRRRNTLAQDPGWWFRPLEADPGFRLLVADS